MDIAINEMAPTLNNLSEKLLKKKKNCGVLKFKKSAKTCFFHK